MKTNDIKYALLVLGGGMIGGILGYFKTRYPDWFSMAHYPHWLGTVLWGIVGSALMSVIVLGHAIFRRIYQ